MPKKSNNIGAVETAFAVLEEILSNEEVGVRELADRLDLPKSTVFSHLRTLHDLGYVQVEEGRYTLSLRFLEYGERIRQSQRVYDIAKPELDRLAEETGELVNLMIEEDDEVVYLYLTSGADGVKLDTYPGRRAPLYCTALGKVALAHMDADRRERYLDACAFEPLTANTITERAELSAALDEIRERGYAFDRGERALELRCVAVPLIVDGAFQGAISVTGPLPRMGDRRFTEELPDKLLDTASVIQINMKYS